MSSVVEPGRVQTSTDRYVAAFIRKGNVIISIHNAIMIFRNIWLPCWMHVDYANTKSRNLIFYSSDLIPIIPM